MARTSKQVDARERARQARLRVDAEREARDRKIEDAAATYFTAADEYAEVERKLAAIEARMSTAVTALVELGESKTRIAALLGITAKDVRRLRADTEQDDSTEASDQQLVSDEVAS